MLAFNIVITGASRGIGLELASQALELGHAVVAGCRNPSHSLELRALAETPASKLKVLTLDVRDDKSVKKFAASVGFDKVDILINNAGIYLDGHHKWSSLGPEILLETLATNTVGPVRMTQALLPLLRKSALARIANISSLMGSVSDNSSGGSLAYRMSKSALNMFTKNLSLDEREMIVLALHPGWVQTELGGKRAPLDAKTSAEGLLRVIRGASLKESGRFFNYTGKELGW